MKKSSAWWIGWLVDLPGVNAQEKTKKELVKALIMGAQDMLATEVPFEPSTEITMVEVPEPAWIGQRSQ